jgi:nitrous oxidase accessory protein
MTTAAIVLLMLLIRTFPAQTGEARELVVDPRGAITTISAALREAADGDRIVVRAGTYQEPTLNVTRSVTITGDAGAILDGGGQRPIMVVSAGNVIVRGLTFRNTGASQVEDRAALLVRESAGCTIERNTFRDTFFAIYLERVTKCSVLDNDLEGSARRQYLGGNGIHAWQSDRIRVSGNTVRGHRDAIYFEFVTNGDVRRNLSERNQRYGLHFMFSDDCVYEENTFQHNGSGVAVMYTRRVRMTANTFARNRGAAAYGLLLKDISDSQILGNRFVENTVALHLEGANRNTIAANTFQSNGWAVRLLANAQENQVTGNQFIGNSFDVGTNSRQNFSTFSGNYWDRYRGYDLDRDGFGDVPFAPVRLFALVVEQTPAALILLRSTMVDLLDFAERILPVLTPQTLVDGRPRMSAERRAQSAGTGAARATEAIPDSRFPIPDLR